MEAIDPVRYISNHSTGKMGYALAKICCQRGAKVTLISGKTNLTAPVGVELVAIKSAQDMYEAVTSRANEQNIIIKAAAVADYRPATVADQKLKKKDDDMSIALERTKDILAYLGEHKQEGQVLCGFAMETEQMVEHAKAKLVKKNLDLIAANNVKVAGAGFGTDTNVVTLITRDEIRELELMSKEEVSMQLTDEVLRIYREKQAAESMTEN